MDGWREGGRDTSLYAAVATTDNKCITSCFVHIGLICSSCIVGVWIFILYLYCTYFRCETEGGCSWGYLPTGIKYQVLAGPAFILIFAFSSLPMGFLASIRSLRRTFVLSACVCLWSLMTLLTGSVTQYWEIVLARFGLGIL